MAIRPIAFSKAPSMFWLKPSKLDWYSAKYGSNTVKSLTILQIAAPNCFSSSVTWPHEMKTVSLAGI
jgi:hypothetical protein